MRHLRYLFWSATLEALSWLYGGDLPLPTYLYLVGKLSDATDWYDVGDGGGEEPF